MSGEARRTAKRGRTALVVRALAGTAAVVAGAIIVRRALGRAARTPGPAAGTLPNPEAPLEPPPSVPVPGPQSTGVEPGPVGTGGPLQVEAHRRRPAPLLAVGLVALVGVAIALPLVLAGSPRGGATAARPPAPARGRSDPPSAETVSSLDPAAGTTGVAPNSSFRVLFSAPLARDSPDPTLSPAVTGTWRRASPTELLFTPAASLVPTATYTVTVPGGPTGMLASDGERLAQSVSDTFTVAPGSVLRLQQLLAELGYLPLQFNGPTPEPQDVAIAQPGIFLWREQGFPAELTSQWSPTQFSALTRGAVMAFETQNGLGIDGVAGARVWSTLIADVTAGKKDGEPVTYVLVDKALPQHLTVWVNGVLTFADVLCNTGVPGATTAEGTFAVFSHVEVSNMRGTDITGSHYDVTVPWASYFNGGDALHGYPRASYGYPQSNGCVEMPIGTAGRVWPDTPVGTIVTVAGTV